MAEPLGSDYLTDHQPNSDEHPAEYGVKPFQRHVLPNCAAKNQKLASSLRNIDESWILDSPQCDDFSKMLSSLSSHRPGGSELLQNSYALAQVAYAADFY